MADPFIDEAALGLRLRRDLSDDDLATLATESACDMVRDECQQILTEEESTITLDGTGTRSLLLPEHPVASIDEVRTVDREDGDASTDEVVLDWILLDNGTIRSTDGVWPVGRMNIEVDCHHGYAEEDFPRSLRIVALQIAERIYAQGIEARRQVGSTATTFQTAGATDLSDGEKRICRRYKRVSQPAATQEVGS